MNSRRYTKRLHKLFEHLAICRSMAHAQRQVTLLRQKPNLDLLCAIAAGVKEFPSFQNAQLIQFDQLIIQMYAIENEIASTTGEHDCAVFLW